MVKIRLRRVGKKGQPSYRVVVTDSRSPRDGRPHRHGVKEKLARNDWNLAMSSCS